MADPRRPLSNFPVWGRDELTMARINAPRFESGAASCARRDQFFNNPAESITAGKNVKESCGAAAYRRQWCSAVNFWLKINKYWGNNLNVKTKKLTLIRRKPEWKTLVKLQQYSARRNEIMLNFLSYCAVGLSRSRCRNKLFPYYTFFNKRVGAALHNIHHQRGNHR